MLQEMSDAGGLVDWDSWFSGWGLLAAAGLMAVASLRELWPWLHLRRTPRNRLVPGRCLVEGVIEAGEDRSPVSVTIDQQYRRGYRANLNRWIERARRVETAPFELRLDDGRRVRVVPTDRAFTLLGKLRTTGEDPFDRRTLAASVSVGERVLVEGELVVPAATADAGPYRADAEAADPPQLVAGGDRPMWIVVEREARAIMLRASLFYAILTLALLGAVVAARGNSSVGYVASGSWLAMLWVYGRSFPPWYRRAAVDQSTF
jgi:hypothetical protein